MEANSNRSNYLRIKQWKFKWATITRGHVGFGDHGQKAMMHDEN